jgi:hypothetical protein
MAKNKNHDKVIREYKKKKSDHLEKLATKMLKHDERMQKLRDKNIDPNLLKQMDRKEALVKSDVYQDYFTKNGIQTHFYLEKNHI